MDFVGKTNPFGGAPKKKPVKKGSPNLADQRGKLALMKIEARQKHEAGKCQKQQKDS